MLHKILVLFLTHYLAAVGGAVALYIFYRTVKAWLRRLKAKAEAEAEYLRALAQKKL